MSEPENLTLRFPREFREEMSAFHRDFVEFRDQTTKDHERFDKQIESLRKIWMGETVVARYAALNVEGRLESIEKRLRLVETLEKRLEKLEQDR